MMGFLENICTVAMIIMLGNTILFREKVFATYVVLKIVLILEDKGSAKWAGES